MSRTEAPPTSLAGTVVFRGTLTLGMSVAAAIVFALSALGPLVTEDLGLSRVQFGLLPSLHSLLAGVTSVVAGKIVDVQGGRRSLLVLFGIGVVGSVLAGMAANYWQLALTVALLAFALALANPATNIVISEHVPSRQQGGVVGLKQAGTPVATALTGLTLPPLALLLGWRPAVQTLALVAGLGLLGVLWSVPRGQRGIDRRDFDPTLPAEHRSMARWLALYAFLMGSGMGSINAFVPLYAHERLGVAVTTGGRLAAVAGISAICSRIVWGYIGNRMARPAIVLKYLGAFAAGAVGFLILAALVDWRLAWVAAVGIGCTSGTWHVPVMLHVIREVGPRSGQVSGRVMRGFFTGMVASPVLFGLGVDHGFGYLAGWGVVAACFAAAGAVQYGRERYVSAGVRV